MWYHSEMVQRHYRYYGLISWAAWILITMWALPWPEGWSLRLFYLLLSVSYPALYLLPSWLVSWPFSALSVQRPESFQRRFSAFLAFWLSSSLIMTFVAASWLTSQPSGASSTQPLSQWLIATSSQLTLLDGILPQQWLSNALLPTSLLVILPFVLAFQWLIFRLAHLIAKGTRKVPGIMRWAILLLAITVCERVFYGFGHFYQVPAVSQLAHHLPGYQPLTMRGFLLSLRFRQPDSESAQADATKGDKQPG